MATVKGGPDMSERFNVRIAVLGDTTTWNPSIPLSTLPSVQATWDAYQDVRREAAAVFRELFPGTIPDESTPYAETAVEWAARKTSSSSDAPTLADYERPTLIWNVRSGDGELYVSYGLLKGSYVLGEMMAARQAGYSEHDWTDIVVWRSEGGQGGDTIWFELLSFLKDQGVTIEALTVEGTKALAASTAGFYFRRIAHAFSRRRRDREARYLVRQWESRNITPYSLRAWFDTKHEWSAEEVSRRLRLTRRSAGALLKALGYAHRGDDIWTLSESKKARKRRAAWLKAEETEWFPEPY